MSRIIQFIGTLLTSLLLVGCDISMFSGKTQVIDNLSSLVSGDNVWPVELSRKPGPMWWISIDIVKTPISWSSASPSLRDNHVTIMLKNTDGSTLVIVRPGRGRELVPSGGFIELYAGSLKTMTHADSIASLAPEADGNRSGFVRVEYIIRSDNAVTFDAPIPLIAYRPP